MYYLYNYFNEQFLLKINFNKYIKLKETIILNTIYFHKRKQNNINLYFYFSLLK